MQKAHDASKNSYWKNLPDVTTPILAEELNRNEQSVDAIDDRVIVFDTSKANQSDLLQTIKTVAYNTTTGVFTFTFWNGSTYTADLNIEKIPVSFSLSPQGILTMTTADGTEYTVDISTLIKLYTFADSTDIDFTTVTDQSGNKTITAHIVAGSVTEDKLEPNFLANCRIEVGKAEDAAEESEAWARGTKNNIPVASTDDQYNNNSKYYSEMAGASATAADNSADECADIKDQIDIMVAQVIFTVDMATGELIYTNESTYNFTVNTTTGNLEWEVVTT